MLTIIVVQVLSELLFSGMLFLMSLEAAFSFFDDLWESALWRGFTVLFVAVLAELFPLSTLILQLRFTVREKERAISIRFTSSLESTGSHSFMWTDFRISRPDVKQLMDERVLGSASTTSLN